MCIAVLGIVVDICLTCLVIAEDGLVVEGIETKLILALHLAYSLILLKTVFPSINKDSRRSHVEKRDGEGVEAPPALRGQCHNQRGQHLLVIDECTTIYKSLNSSSSSWWT